MKKMIFLALACILNAGCVLNMNMIHTEGTADDVVEDTTTNEPNVAPVITVPPIVPAK